MFELDCSSGMWIMVKFSLVCSFSWVVSGLILRLLLLSSSWTIVAVDVSRLSALVVELDSDVSVLLKFIEPIERSLKWVRCNSVVPTAQHGCRASLEINIFSWRTLCRSTFSVRRTKLPDIMFQLWAQIFNLFRILHGSNHVIFDAVLRQIWFVWKIK